MENRELRIEKIEWMVVGQLWQRRKGEGGCDWVERELRVKLHRKACAKRFLSHRMGTILTREESHSFCPSKENLAREFDISRFDIR